MLETKRANQVFRSYERKAIMKELGETEHDIYADIDDDRSEDKAIQQE